MGFRLDCGLGAVKLVICAVCACMHPLLGCWAAVACGGPAVWMRCAHGEPRLCSQVPSHAPAWTSQHHMAQVVSAVHAFDAQHKLRGSRCARYAVRHMDCMGCLPPCSSNRSYLGTARRLDARFVHCVKRDHFKCQQIATLNACSSSTCSHATRQPACLRTG